MPSVAVTPAYPYNLVSPLSPRPPLCHPGLDPGCMSFPQQGHGLRIKSAMTKEKMQRFKEMLRSHAYQPVSRALGVIVLKP